MSFAALVLVVAGLVHLLPLAGLLGPERLQQLYGVALGGDANLTLLLRHRALLFGLLGALMLFAAFRPPLQVLALAMALVSVAGFLLLGSPGELNEAMRRVWWIDAALLPPLLAALALQGLRTTR